MTTKRGFVDQEAYRDLITNLVRNAGKKGAGVKVNHTHRAKDDS